MVTRSTRRTTRREAERVAAVWEADLIANRYAANSRITWKDFREKYVDQDTDEVADELRKMSKNINTSTNTPTPEAQESEKESD